MVTRKPNHRASEHPLAFSGVLVRLVTADILKTFLAVLTVLLLILMTKYFAQILGKAFQGQISNETIMQLFGFKMITMGIRLLPASLFAAILILLGRMYRDSEMSAMGSAGIGYKVLYKYILLLAIPLAVVGAGLALELKPWLAKETARVLQKEQETSAMRLLVEGRFNEYKQGDIVFYAEEISADQQMRNVFIQQLEKNKVSVVVSRKGYTKIVDGVRFVVLVEGRRYLGKLGMADYEISEFDEYAVSIDEPKKGIPSLSRDATPSLVLWHSDNGHDRAELEKRLSIPLGILLLAVLAVPLSNTAPRSGVYGNIVVAFLVYLLYKNLLSIARNLLVNDSVPLYLGSWWVYVVMIGIGLGFTIRHLGVEWCLFVLKCGKGQDAAPLVSASSDAPLRDPRRA
ncbi:MAG: LPS export ABC transporter permease LptF [Pseudomonadota bacterium]|nr:LPS export ABC transporter permease LptF [Pseudomonadota bacterium]